MDDVTYFAKSAWADIKKPSPFLLGVLTVLGFVLLLVLLFIGLLTAYELDLIPAKPRKDGRIDADKILCAQMAPEAMKDYAWAHFVALKQEPKWYERPNVNLNNYGFDSIARVEIFGTEKRGHVIDFIKKSDRTIAFRMILKGDCHVVWPQQPKQPNTH